MVAASASALIWQWQPWKGEERMNEELRTLYEQDQDESDNTV